MPCLVDDAFEQPSDRVVIERTGVVGVDVAQHFRFARGLVDRDAHLTFQSSDLERARRSGVQQSHERFVEQVDSLPEVVEVRLHACPFSHRTYAPALPATSGDAPCSAMTFTSALPTTAASAHRLTSATCSGREIPKPSASGSLDCARMRATSGSASDAIRSRAPVTPSRE